MNIRLNNCAATRPDKRAIINLLLELSGDLDQYTAQEYMDILLAGDGVEIEITSNTSSAFRALRKLQIDYDIL